MFAVRRPSDAALAAVLERVRDAPLTYPSPGMTAAAAGVAPGEGDGLPAGAGAADPPAGFHAVRAERAVGSGDRAWAAACDALRTWQLHRRQGFRVAPAAPALTPGTAVVSAIPLAGPVHVLAACRVVWTVDRPDRFGFAYGTLPVHPASGEEAFVVERTAGGEVRGIVAAHSRLRHPLVRLGGPIARRQQATATEGYLDALAAHVGGATARGT